jgi:hypothetical protein
LNGGKNYVLYSDNWGQTWNILGGSNESIATADEPKVEILPNGQILLSSRHATGGSRVFNVFTYGNNKAEGEGTWGKYVSGCNNGGSNGTNGEIICLDAKKSNGESTKILLQSQPKGGSNTWDRKNVTIWYKELNEETYTSNSFASGWIQGLEVSPADVQSAYSTMCLQEDGKIDSWAVRFGFAHFKHHAVAILPCRSYVTNIGFDGTGTHSGTVANVYENDLSQSVTNPRMLDMVYEDDRIINAFYNAFTYQRRPFWQKAINYIARKLGKKAPFVIKKKVYA